MAPPPEFDKEPKAPDKSATNISSDDTTNTHNLDNELQTNSDSKTGKVKANYKVKGIDVDALNDIELKDLLDEAISYKRPKDRDGKSNLFRGLLDEVEQDDEVGKAVARSFSSVRSSNSLTNLFVAACLVPDAPHSRPHPAPTPAPVSARAIHGGSLPSGVDTSSLVCEEPAEYVATVRCFNPSPLTDTALITDATNVANSVATANNTACSTNSVTAHETDPLNRRNKPMYTARATLEIGSGSVCTGRAVTTTTASNQVRTRSRPHPRTPHKTLHTPATDPHRHQTIPDKSDDRPQNKLMNALRPSAEGGGKAMRNHCPDKPRGPKHNHQDKRQQYVTAKSKCIPTGIGFHYVEEQKGTNSRMLMQNIDKWYEKLNTYFKPPNRHSRSDHANTPGIGRAQPQPYNFHLNEYEDYSERPLISNIGAGPSSKGGDKLNRVNCYGDSKESDTRNKKEYFRRVGNSLVQPKLLPINPKNVRNMSLGKQSEKLCRPKQNTMVCDNSINSKDSKVISGNAATKKDVTVKDLNVKSSVKENRVGNKSKLNVKKDSLDNKTTLISKRDVVETESQTELKENVYLEKVNCDIELLDVSSSKNIGDRTSETFSSYLTQQNKLIEMLETNSVPSNEENNVVKVLDSNNVTKHLDAENIQNNNVLVVNKDRLKIETNGVLTDTGFVTNKEKEEVEVKTEDLKIAEEKIINKEIKKPELKDSKETIIITNENKEHMMDEKLEESISKEIISNEKKGETFIEEFKETNVDVLAEKNFKDENTLEANNEGLNKSTVQVATSEERDEAELKDLNRTNMSIPLEKKPRDVNTLDVIIEEIEDIQLAKRVTGNEEKNEDSLEDVKTNIVVPYKQMKDEIVAGDRSSTHTDVPEIAYVFLTLSKRLLTPMCVDSNGTVPTCDVTNQTGDVSRSKNVLSSIMPDFDVKKRAMLNKNALRLLMFDNPAKGEKSITGKSSKNEEIDTAISFSCITTPEVVTSCSTTSSTAQATVAIDSKPLQLGSCYRALGSLAGSSCVESVASTDAAETPTADEVASDATQQARSVITSSFNGLPLSRPNYGATASTTTTSSDEYKKSLDENGNSVQGYNSASVTGSSQHSKKPRRKKSSKNESVIESQNIDGYQGNKDLNEVLRFIESNADSSRAHKLGRAKHKDDSDEKGGKKRSTERRKDKENKIKRATSLEELSRTKLEDLTDKPEPTLRKNKKERWTDGDPSVKAERRSWGDDARELYADTTEAASVELTDFQTVTKKRKPRRRTDEAEKEALGDAVTRRARPPSPRPRRESAPPSDRSNDSNDDMDSVHSLPAPAPASAAHHASYADIARTRHNIPDLIESCNFYAENANSTTTVSTAAGDADGYPALDRGVVTRVARTPPTKPPERKEARRERKERGDCPAPDVVADRRPPVVLLDSTARPRELDGVTFGFDINEQLLSGSSRSKPRCDLVREAAARDAKEPQSGVVPVVAGSAALRYVPPAPASDTHLLHQLVDYVGSAWEDIMRCSGGKVLYYTD